jgi:ribulose 1,5-bisphosphate synthetase/thiazole synthase
MKDEQILEEILKELGIIVKEKDYSYEKQRLVEKINELINNDFQKLVSILYRMDVSEIKLKQLLKDNPGTDAGLIIADLMIERQEEKIKSRQQFNKRDENISDDEKW